MAFNWATFKTRSLTAAVFVVVMLGGLFWNHWSFFLLFSVIHFGCWWEYLKLTEKIHNTVFHPYTKMGFMLLGYAILLWFCGPIYHISNYSLSENISLPVSVAGFVMLVIGIFQKNAVKMPAFAMALFAMLYISVSLGMMMGIASRVADPCSDVVLFKSYNYVYPAIMIGSIWINDTMAYIVGSLIGKTPFSKISPKKTWEGTIGGAVLCVGVAYLIGVLWLDFDPTVVISFSIIAAVMGTIGDLFESWLKRKAGVKDSGSIMPGHGGFLDRFDSLLFTIPLCWFLTSPYTVFQC